MFGKLEQRQRKVAVACGILVEIVLMILLGAVEVIKRLLLYHERLLIVLLLFGVDLLDDGQVCGIGIVDACAVACSFVVTLSVEACGIDSLEEHLQQESEAYHIGVVTYMNGLGIACCVGINLLV